MYMDKDRQQNGELSFKIYQNVNVHTAMFFCLIMSVFIFEMNRLN